MADTAPTTTATPAAAPPLTADGLDRLVKLAAESRGLDIVTVSAPADVKGVPTSIPIGIVHGASPQAVNLSGLFEHYRTKPARKRGVAEATTLDSFIDLIARHKTEHSAVFANTDWRAPSFQAVIDYHLKDSTDPDNLGHRIDYKFPLSEEWKAWIKFDGEPMAQRDFAAFIEDNIGDLASPTEFEETNWTKQFQTTFAAPNQLIELSRGLQVFVASEVKNAITLQTGEGQITFTEEHRDAGGKPLKVPGLFLLAIAPFFMGDQVRVPVRLRYRANGGKLVWAYQIYRPDQHITERVRADLDKVAAGTELPMFEGSPEK